jgi:hypothetical protein
MSSDYFYYILFSDFFKYFDFSKKARGGSRASFFIFLLLVFLIFPKIQLLKPEG